MGKEFETHKLINLWYTVLNNTQGFDKVLNELEGYLVEGGYNLENLVRQSEQCGNPMIRSMCYDVLKKVGRPITDEQEKFLREHRWQDAFWPH